MTITENIRKELQTLVDSKYQEFHSALVPGTENILGVRIPQLRVMAKEIAKRDDWRIFIEATDTKFYEEAMLQGMVIGRSKKGKETVWQFIQPYLKSPQEFELRFGIVMLFHYIDEEHIDLLLKYTDSFCHDAYYARMAMAWMISICFVKFPEKTMEYLKHSKLDNWTYNKSLQKTIESLRVDKRTKDVLRSMKRR